MSAASAVSTFGASCDGNFFRKRRTISYIAVQSRFWMFLKRRMMVCRVLCGIALVTLAMHFSIFLIATFRDNEGRKMRLIPRQIDDVDATYLQINLQNHRRLRAQLIDPDFTGIRGGKNKDFQELMKDYYNIEGDTSEVPFKCTSCALVGNSGNLLNSNKGSRIDRSSCVFRLALAPVKGYETDVGSKTTARITSSSRLYPFLKKPKKLISGPFSSDRWFLFDRRKGDITRLYRRLLLPLIQKDRNVGFFWFSRKSELSALQSLRRAGQELKVKMTEAHPDTLWYTLQVMEDAGCVSYEMFGIPDPQICKRSQNDDIRSRYWESSSPRLCFGGKDAGSMTRSLQKTNDEITSLFERRSLVSWSMNRNNVTFDAPPWPSPLFS